MRINFPKDFVWGTSTAAAQVETAFEHNWKGVKARDGYTFDRTTDHEKRRDEDIGYISKFGTVYRCGVDWSRLQRAPLADFDLEVVKEYQDFFEKLEAENMKIMFVLHHFCNPLWFENNGTWLNKDNIPAFIDFVKKCILHFGKYATYWNTFNEPNVYAMNGFMLGNFPPFKKSYFKANKVIKNLGAAHDIAYDLLKEYNADIPIGISQNTAYFDGINIFGKLPAKLGDWWFNKFSATHFEKLDFWGISYYARIVLNPAPITEIDNPGKLDKMGIRHDKMWAYHPEGLGEILRRFYEKYKKPIIITENGICSDDPQERIGSIKDYLKVCHDAIQDGVDLKGYIHWSTWDNFEWNLGPTYRFGLVTVDFKTMDRTFTKAADFYSKVTKENAVDI